MDTNFFGFPKEDSAISQNAKGGPLGGPKWEDAKFLLKVQELTLDPLKIYRFGPDEID